MKITTIFWFLPLVFFASCQDLDKEVITTLSENDVSTTYEMLQYNAMSVYEATPNEFTNVGNAMLCSATDDAEFTDPSSGIQRFNTGSWNAYSIPDDAWNQYYTAIRKANLFLSNVTNVNLEYYRTNPNLTAEYTRRSNNLKQWSYEVRFLRAFFYFELIKRYGGVPLITKPLKTDENYSKIKRDSLVTCANFITAECDSAASVLTMKPPTTADLGRATKVAALALKSQALLFEASDLWNDPSWANTYGNAHPEFISLPTGDRAKRWKAAADAALAVINTGLTMEVDYQVLFNSTNYNSKEVIFCRRNAPSNDFERLNYPIGFDVAQGGNTPSQNLVDAYEVKTSTTVASPFDWNDPVQAANPYGTTRDKRLGYSIITNGSQFKGRTIDCNTVGKDGSGVKNATRTGYYLKKYSDPNLDLLLGTTSVHTWIYIRAAEIYLNYAEALNEYAPGNTAIKTNYDKTRNRLTVKMPLLAAGLSQDVVRQKIRNERRVELSFEGKRFFDVRRWMIASATQNVPLRAVKIENNVYTPFNLENRVFEAKMYFYPIPQGDILKMNWVQNPGWN